MARQFAKMYCELLRTREFLDLTPEARWTWAFLKMQEDLTRAGIITIRLPAWARGLGYSQETVVNAVNELAATEFVVVDWDEMQALMRRHIITDEVYRVPNSMIAADHSIRDCRSPAILGALHWEMRELLGQVPEIMLKKGISRTPRDVVTSLIGHLEGYAYPSTTPPLPPSMGSVGVREPTRAGSAVPTPRVEQTAPGPQQNGTIWGERMGSPEGSGTLPSLKSQVQVVGKSQDSRLQTPDKSPGGGAPDDDDPGPGSGAGAIDDAVAQHPSSLTIGGFTERGAGIDGASPPADAAARESASGRYPETAQGLVAWWIDSVRERIGDPDYSPPGKTLGHASRLLKEMLEEGIPFATVRRGLWLWVEARKASSPSLLPDFVNDVMTGALTPMHPARPRAGQEAHVQVATSIEEMVL